MSESQEEQEYVPREFAYAGRRVNAKGKVSYVLVPIDEGGVIEDGAERWYGKSPGVSVGSIVTIPEKAGTASIQFGGLRYVRPLKEQPETVALWRSKDLAAEAWFSNKSLITKSKKVEPLEDILDPIKELSLRLTPPERRALAVRILEVLR